jgi:SAM-dependent methyltransferase
VDDRQRWNERHRGRLAGEGPSTHPVDWVASHAALLDAEPRGRALDVACGMGRNAVLLAELGFDVDAVDVSDVAVDHVADVAGRRALSIATERLDLRQGGGFPRPPYRVIVCTYFLERSLFATIAGALDTGGLLVLETFTEAQAGERWGPSDPRFLLHAGELERAFPDLDLVEHREVTLDDDGDPLHVASIVARRPAGARRASADHVDGRGGAA